MIPALKSGARTVAVSRRQANCQFINEHRQVYSVVTDFLSEGGPVGVEKNKYPKRHMRE